MRNWSIFAGRLLGVELRIDLNFFFLLLFVSLSPPVQFGGIEATRAVALVGIIFISVLIREVANIIVAKRAGLPIRGIILTPIGALRLIDPQEQTETARASAASLRIALTGPIVNLLTAAISAAVFLELKHEPGIWGKPLLTTQALARSFVWTNVLLALLHLLPGLPLDGGRILRLRLAPALGFQQATRRAVTIGNVIAFGFMLLGAAKLPWLMLAGVFIFMAAQREERTATFQAMAETMRVEEIMLTHFFTLSPADTLEDALHQAVHTLQDDFPVVRGGDLVGTINRQTIVDRLRREGNGYVQGAMNKAFEIVSRAESLTSALRKLTGRGITLIPVVDQERLVGIVTLQNLMHSVGLLAESKKLRQREEEG